MSENGRGASDILFVGRQLKKGRNIGEVLWSSHEKRHTSFETFYTVQWTDPQLGVLFEEILSREQLELAMQEDGVVGQGDPILAASIAPGASAIGAPWPEWSDPQTSDLLFEGRSSELDQAPAVQEPVPRGQARDISGEGSRAEADREPRVVPLLPVALPQAAQTKPRGLTDAAGGTNAAGTTLSTVAGPSSNLSSGKKRKGQDGESPGGSNPPRETVEGCNNGSWGLINDDGLVASLLNDPADEELGSPLTLWPAAAEDMSVEGQGESLPATPHMAPHLQGGPLGGPDPDPAAAVPQGVPVAVPSAAGGGPRDGSRDSSPLPPGLGISDVYNPEVAAVIESLLFPSPPPGAARSESPPLGGFSGTPPPVPMASEEAGSPELPPPPDAVEQLPQPPKPRVRKSTARGSRLPKQPAKRQRTSKKMAVAADDGAGGSGGPAPKTGTRAPQGGRRPRQGVKQPLTSGPGLNGLGFVKLVDGVSVTVEAKDVKGPFTYVQDNDGRRRYPTEYFSREGDIPVEEYENIVFGEEEEFKVEAILDERRTNPQGKKQRTRSYMVKYEGYALEWDNWIARKDLSDCVLLDDWDRMCHGAAR
eukprot:jgi/Botrbrau1/1473/Bobra.178_3s0030.1